MSIAVMAESVARRVTALSSSLPSGDFPSDAIHPARKPDAPTRVISDWSRSAKVAGRVPLRLP
jgi:hypothetical protein